MQRMCCQRSTLRVGNSCCIMLYPCSDGAPQRCQWMPLCSVALSPHVLSLAKYLFMAFEKIHRIQIPPNYLCAHDAFKITKQLSTEVVLSLTLHQIIPPLHSLSSPPAISGAPGLRCPQHPRRRATAKLPLWSSWSPRAPPWMLRTTEARGPGNGRWGRQGVEWRDDLMQSE